jgi:hypothetical protein
MASGIRLGLTAFKTGKSTENVTKTALRTGLDYVEADDINDLLKSHGEKLSEQLNCPKTT